MREIEFRGKRLDNGEWVYGNYCESLISGCFILCFKMGTKGVKHGFSISDNLVVYEVDYRTVGQFVRYGKNNIKIFKGDIVAESVAGEVIWDGEGVIVECPLGVVVWQDFTYNVLPVKKGKVKLKEGCKQHLDDINGFAELNISRHDGQFYKWDYLDVIGNIYENSILLDYKHQRDFTEEEAEKYNLALSKIAKYKKTIYIL